MKNKKSAVALALPLFFAASPIASCEPGSTQGGDTLTIMSYLKPVHEKAVHELSCGEIRFGYYLRDQPTGVGKDKSPLPCREAILRSVCFPDKVYPRLFSCTVAHAADPPPRASIDSYCGTLTIILEPGRYFDPVDELSAFPGRTVEIRIYRETDSVWFDGIWWRIDAEFWDWLHDSFPFTKINIHRKPKDQPNETDETETAQAPLPVGQRSGAAPDPGNDMPEEVDRDSRP